MDPYIGQIQLFPYNFEPRGWVLCDGRTMQIMQNQALYSLIGITFGGNATTEFKICLLYTSPSPRDRQKSRMPSSA